MSQGQCHQFSVTSRPGGDLLMTSGLSHLPLAGEDFHIWETAPDCLLVTTIRVLREELKLKLATALGVLLGYDLLFLHPREWGSEHLQMEPRSTEPRWNVVVLFQRNDYVSTRNLNPVNEKKLIGPSNKSEKENENPPNSLRSVLSCDRSVTAYLLSW